MNNEKYNLTRLIEADIENAPLAYNLAKGVGLGVWFVCDLMRNPYVKYGYSERWQDLVYGDFERFSTPMVEVFWTIRWNGNLPAVERAEALGVLDELAEYLAFCGNYAKGKIPNAAVTQ